MDKLEKTIQKNKLGLFFFWFALVYLVLLCVYGLSFKKVTGITEILFAFAIASFVYTDIMLTIDYKKTKRIINGVNGIKVRYEFIQTYIKGKQLIVEIQRKQEERLKKDLAELEIEFKEFKHDDKLIQYIIDL